MDLLNTTNVVKLQSQRRSYMVAHEDEKVVLRSPNGSSRTARWRVERVQGKPNVIRLKSYYSLYLTASDGKVDWEPIRDGDDLKLKSLGDKLLQTNGEPNSIRHDEQKSGKALNWTFWYVELVSPDKSSSSTEKPNDRGHNNAPISMDVNKSSSSVGKYNVGGSIMP